MIAVQAGALTAAIDRELPADRAECVAAAEAGPLPADLVQRIDQAVVRPDPA